MRIKWTILAVLFPLLVWGACGETPKDRIETIAKLKILAVKAERPELHPGEVTSIHVLAAAPSATSITTLVIPFSQSQNTDISDGEVDFSSAGRTFAYFAGSTIPAPPVRPGVPLPSKHVPNSADVFYQAPATPGAYTLGAFVVEGVPDIQLAGAQSADAQELFDASLKALKTLRVKPEGETLNLNPKITGFRALKRWRKVEEGRLESPAAPEGWTLGRGEVLRVEVLAEDEDAERWSAVWWISDGEARGYGRRDIDWRAPMTVGIETLTALALDRIGGVDWAFRDIAVGVSALEPDIVDEEAAETLLVESGTRMVWLGFADPASATSVRELVEAGHAAAVKGTVKLSSEARLGWYLSAPQALGAWETYTGPTTTASGLGYPTGVSEVVLRVDSVVR